LIRRGLRRRNARDVPRCRQRRPLVVAAYKLVRGVLARRAARSAFPRELGLASSVFGDVRAKKTTTTNEQKEAPVVTKIRAALGLFQSVSSAQTLKCFFLLK
jgi:hypothetical protein